MLALLRHLARNLEAATPSTVWHRLTLVLNDDAHMRDLKRTWFAKDETTDSISFRYEAIPGEPAGSTGEIYANVEEAWREGTQRATSSPERELALYIAHGLHHLSGASDDTPAQRQAMIRTEWAWVKTAERHGVLDGLFRPNRQQTKPRLAANTHAQV